MALEKKCHLTRSMVINNLDPSAIMSFMSRALGTRLGNQIGSKTAAYYLSDKACYDMRKNMFGYGHVAGCAEYT